MMRSLRQPSARKVAISRIRSVIDIIMVLSMLTKPISIAINDDAQASPLSNCVSWLDLT